MNPRSKKQIHPLLAKKKPNWVVSRATDGSLSLSLSIKMILFSTSSLGRCCKKQQQLQVAPPASPLLLSCTSLNLLLFLLLLISTQICPLNSELRASAEREGDRELSLFLLERNLQRALRDHGFVVGRWCKKKFFSAITIHFLLSL